VNGLLNCNGRQDGQKRRISFRGGKDLGISSRGGQNWEYCPGLAYVKDRNIVGNAMKDSTPVRNRTEMLRRRKIRKFWADPEHREDQRKRQNKFWDDPKRREDQRERMKGFMADPKHREALSKAMKREMADPKRREAQSKIMKQLKADPRFEARRIAAVKKAMAEPEEKARRAATLRKTLAIPAVRRRRIKNIKKVTTGREYRAAMSAARKKWWDDIRARLTGPTGTTKNYNRRRGRPRMDERYGIAAMLHEQGESYRQVARQKDPNFAKDPDAATERMRLGIRRFKQAQKKGEARQ
jgi:hypothetical protein